jgi:hypothetical protein
VATPILQRHTLPGTQGSILIEILAASDRSPRPAVIFLRACNGLEHLLARAGFTAISFNPNHPAAVEDPADLESVIAALDRGELNAPRPTSIGIVGYDSAGGTAILAAARIPRIAALVTGAGVPSSDVEAAAARVTVPWLRVSGTGNGAGCNPELERVFDETTGWLARHLP